MNDKTLEIKTIAESNKAITLSHVNLTGALPIFILNESHYLTLSTDKFYSITFLYNIKDIVKQNNVGLFINSIFTDVIEYSPAVISSMHIIHKMIIENLEKLEYFTDLPLVCDSCKGNVTVILDRETNTFDSIVMSGLLSCQFKDDSSCFYNISYSYSTDDDLGFVLSKNTVSKTLNKFSNNAFLCLIDKKMADVITDVYVDYTREHIANIKTLHGMVSI